MKIIISILLVFSIFTHSALLAATPGIDSLKKRTIKSFLLKANNPKTPLHKKLLELNQVDGRNSNGIFPKNLTIKDIQVVAIDGEDQFGAYCHGVENRLEQFKCSSSITETYLILIPAKTHVHKATEYSHFLFVVKSSKNIEWEKDQQERISNYKESIEIGEPSEIQIEKLVKNR